MNGPLKYHGGKHYLAGRIAAIAESAPHAHYVEPFAGGLSVLFAKNPEGVSEAVNDADRDPCNFWRVLQCPARFYAFQRVVEAVPFSEWEWREADPDSDRCPDAVERAAAFFVRCRQSLAGRRGSFAPLSRTRTRRGMNEQAAAWLSAVEGLPAVHARLKRVAVLCRDALDVIRQQDGPGTLFYLDPPYLHATRATTGEYGPHEMTEARHAELLDLVKRAKGKAMLSGYPSALYDDALAGWARHEFDLPNNAAGGKGKRRVTEVLWCNW